MSKTDSGSHPAWHFAAVGLIAGSIGYQLHAFLAGRAEARRRGETKPVRPIAHDVGRWENEGGMVATPVKAQPAMNARRDEPVGSTRE